MVSLLLVYYISSHMYMINIMFTLCVVFSLNHASADSIELSPRTAFPFSNPFSGCIVTVNSVSPKVSGYLII